MITEPGFKVQLFVGHYTSQASQREFHGRSGIPRLFPNHEWTHLRGREFTESEVQSDARVAVVNEPFASEFGSTADTVGRQATTGNNPSWRIIGVVKGMDSMADEPNAPQVFVPAQLPGGFFSTFAARVDGRAEDRFAMIRDAIQSVDPQVPVFGVKTMEQRLGADPEPKFGRARIPGAKWQR